MRKSDKPGRLFICRLFRGSNIGCLLLTAVLWLSPVKCNAFVSVNDQVSVSKALAHYIMGQVYDFLGFTNRAILEYQESSQFDPAIHWPYLRVGADYARLGMFAEAKTALLSVYQHKPDDLQSHYLMALIYSTEKQYDKAAEEYEFILKAASENDPGNIEVYGYLAQLYYSQHKYNQAALQFERILAIDPKNADVMYLLGSLYFEAERTDEAVTVLKRAIDIDPEHDGCLNTLAYIYAEESRNLDEAADLVNRAIKIAPDEEAYLDTLGWVYYKKGKYDKALEVLNKAGNIQSDPVIFDHIGDVYQALNNLDKAVEYWQKSLELNPDQEIVDKKIKEVKGAQASHNGAQ